MIFYHYLNKNKAIKNMGLIRATLLDQSNKWFQERND